MAGLGFFQGRDARRRRSAPGGGTGTSPSGLAVNDIFVLAGNSYEAQAGMNDNAGWARFYSGCKGYAPLAWRHARGGDTLDHLLGSATAYVEGTGRLTQILAMNPKGIFFMSPQNSMGIGVPSMQVQYEALVTACRAAGVQKMVFPTQVRTASTNETDRTAINAWLKDSSTGLSRHPEVVIADRAAALDLTVPGYDNGAADHTNARGAVICGQVDGAAIASCFASGAIRVSDFAVPLPGNFNPDWNMADSNSDGLCDGWVLSNVYTGCAVTTARGFFRSPGMTGVPCQVLKVTGTSAVSPVTSGNELRLRKSIAVSPPTTAVVGKSWRMMMFMEITNADAPDWAAASGPQSLATLHLSNGFGVFSSKTYLASNGAVVMDKFAGLVSTLPAIQRSAAANVTCDVSARPMQSTAASYEIRFGYVMLMLDEQSAYAAPYDHSPALPAGRPAIFATQSLTGTPVQGSNLLPNSLALVTGGGMQAPAMPYGSGIAYPANGFVARTPYSLPGDVAGDIEPAREGASIAAAVPYTVQAGDVGAKLRYCIQWENPLGSLISYSAETATVT